MFVVLWFRWGGAFIATVVFIAVPIVFFFFVVVVAVVVVFFRGIYFSAEGQRSLGR